MTGAHEPQPSDLTDAHWFKATASETAQGCVEVAFLPGNHIAVRDSKNPNGPKLTFTNHEWARFLGRTRPAGDH